MKFWYKFLFLPILILAFVGCDDDREFVNLYQPEVLPPEDGVVTQLQKHTIGNGVPIVIMVDRFTDVDIKSGKYRQATNWALKGLFSVHPMDSLRNYFDVYEVTAVSYASQSVGTAFDTQGGDIRSSNCDKAVEYAEKAIGEDRIDDATIIILYPWKDNEIVNFCYQSATTPSSDYSGIPTGCAVACVGFNLDGNGAFDRTTHYVALLHEAVGHGFAGLADEYSWNTIHREEGEYDDSYKEWVMEEQKQGFWRNVSFDSDVTKTCWADFAADSRYNYEKLGCYEGALYTGTGVYRPTERGLMYNTDVNDGFNVAGRVMIYKRCMKIAYGDSWKFDYEDFVTFDMKCKGWYNE